MAAASGDRPGLGGRARPSCSQMEWNATTTSGCSGSAHTLFIVSQRLLSRLNGVPSQSMGTRARAYRGRQGRGRLIFRCCRRRVCIVRGTWLPRHHRSRRPEADFIIKQEGSFRRRGEAVRGGSSRSPRRLSVASQARFVGALSPPGEPWRLWSEPASLKGKVIKQNVPNFWGSPAALKLERG